MMLSLVLCVSINRLDLMSWRDLEQKVKRLLSELDLHLGEAHMVASHSERVLVDCCATWQHTPLTRDLHEFWNFRILKYLVAPR